MKSNMHISEISHYLEVYRNALGYKFPNDMWLKVQRAVFSPGTIRDPFTLEEVKYLADACYHLRNKYEQACGTIANLAQDNQRLQNENDFMLKLINDRLNND